MVRARKVGALAVGAAAAGALVLVAPHAPSAFAAGGTFSYTAADGKPRTSANPPSQMCLGVVGSGLVKNMTDESVTLYSTPDCAEKNRITTIGSKSMKNNVAKFQSLLWADPDAEGADDDSNSGGDSGSHDHNSSSDSGANAPSGGLLG